MKRKILLGLFCLVFLGFLLAVGRNKNIYADNISYPLAGGKIINYKNQNCVLSSGTCTAPAQHTVEVYTCSGSHSVCFDNGILGLQSASISQYAKACTTVQIDVADSNRSHVSWIVWVADEQTNCVPVTPTPTPTLTTTPTPTSTPTPTLTPTPTPGPLSPVCDFLTANVTTSSTTPFTVNFTGQGHSTTHGISQYKFDFGDGNTALQSGNTISHTYNNSGTFTATLTIIDNQGLTGTAENCRIKISPSSPPPEQPKSGAETTLTFGLILSLVLGIMLKKFAI